MINSSGVALAGSWLDVSVGKGNDPSVCAIKMDGVTPTKEGTLWCWGTNDNGQLGRNTFDYKCTFCGNDFNSLTASPAQVNMPAGSVNTWKKITSGYSFSNLAYKANPTAVIIQ